MSVFITRPSAECGDLRVTTNSEEQVVLSIISTEAYEPDVTVSTVINLDDWKAIQEFIDTQTKG